MKGPNPLGLLVDACSEHAILLVVIIAMTISLIAAGCAFDSLKLDVQKGALTSPKGASVPMLPNGSFMDSK